nr:extensin-2-like isoform X3 [Lepeophtheirus salmonis]
MVFLKIVIFSLSMALATADKPYSPHRLHQHQRSNGLVHFPVRQLHGLQSRPVSYRTTESEYKTPEVNNYEAPEPKYTSTVNVNSYKSPESEYKSPEVNSYKSPGSEYKTPEVNNYEAPETKYTSTVNANSYKSPESDYKSPEVNSYKSPESDYNSPEVNIYKATESEYKTPEVNSYKAPKPSYSSPTVDNSYKSPESEYKSPEVNNYKEPEPQYKSPEPQYKSPEPQYKSSEPQYKSPEPQYKSPEPQYKTHEVNSYISPEPQYNVPEVNNYKAPVFNSYKSPESGYKTPEVNGYKAPLINSYKSSKPSHESTYHTSQPSPSHKDSITSKVKTTKPILSSYHGLGNSYNTPNHRHGYLASKSNYSPHSKPEAQYHDIVPKYQYQYGVSDADHYTDFEVQEERDGAATTGSYRVNLPDGRIQIVNYRADEYGYKADIQYEGTPHYPDQKSVNLKTQH